MNKLSDFKLNTQVIYRYEDGRIDLGVAKGYYCENIRVQWGTDDDDDLIDYHFTNPQIILVSSLVNRTVNKPENTIVENKEEQFLDLIIDLIAVNQTELACDIIGVLQKYKHNIKALDFIERNIQVYLGFKIPD